MVEFPNKSPYPETEAQAYVARLSQRPALAALTGLLASFPVVKIFASNGVPLMLSREKGRLLKESEAKSGSANVDF